MAKTMNRRAKVRNLTLIALIVFLLIAIIGGTYARYTSTASGTSTAAVAKWAVKINETDIVTEDEFTINFTEVENNDVVDGKIAPASTLYADLEIDPTGSEVAIDYSFQLGAITASEGDVPTDLKISKVCKIDGGNETELTAIDGEYTGTIALKSQTTALAEDSKVKVRVYVEWQNTEANSALHTAAGKLAPILTMDVTGTAKQHITESPV